MDDEELEILHSARDLKLPDPLNASSGINMERVSELIDAGLLKGIDGTNFDEPVYGDVRITHTGRQRIQALELT
jgi:hypothetical protein